MSEGVLSPSREQVPEEPIFTTELQAALSSAEPVSPSREFNYHPVPIAAPVSLFLGLCSFVGLFTFIGLGIGLFGMLLGAVCLIRIRQSNGELGGKWIALSGGLLSFVFLVSGAGWHSYNFATEVPEGFERLNFLRDISKKGFIVESGKNTINPEVAALDGKSVFIKGYMYPERMTSNLSQFLLVKDNDVCCFGGQPKLCDMIMVKMADGLKADHRSGLVSVAGVFHVAKHASPAGYDAAYTIEATHVESARSSF